MIVTVEHHGPRWPWN